MEKLSVKGMIESILLDLADNQPIGSYALKIQMVSKMLKNEKLSAWLDKELNGYKNKDDLPEHRILKTHIIADLVIDHGFKGAKLSNYEMPLYTLKPETAEQISTVHVYDSIVTLGAINKIKGYSLNEYEKYLLSTIYENSNILSAYKRVALSNIDEIIHKFKSTLLDIFMELNDTIFNDKIDFDLMAKRKDIEKIVTQTINAGIVNMGEGSISVNESTAIGGQNNAVTINNDTKEEIKKIVKQIQEISDSFEDEKEEVLNELTRIVTQLGESEPKTNIITSALQTINGLLMGVTGNLATPVVIEGIHKVLRMIGGYDI